MFFFQLLHPDIENLVDTDKNQHPIYYSNNAKII